MGAEAQIVRLFPRLEGSQRLLSRPARHLVRVTALTGFSVPVDAEGDVKTRIEQWIAHRVATGELKERSAGSIRCMLQTLLTAVGDLEPEDLTSEILLAWQATVGGYSPSYRAHMVSTVKGFSRWLVDQGHLRDDPSTRLAKVKQPRSVPRALSQDQAERVLEMTSNQRDRAIVVLMLQMGLRCIEVVRLDYEDWDRHAGTLFVRGKGGHERVIPVTDRAAVELSAWVLECSGLCREPCLTGPLIRGFSPRSPADGRVTATWLSTHISRLMTAAGVHEKGDRRTAHALRHTAASDVLDRSKDLRVVQAMLGHQSLASTEVYLRRADLGRLREAMEGRDYRMADERAGPDSGRSLPGAGSRGAQSPQAPDPTEGYMAREGA